MKILPNLKSIKLNACSMDVELIINESNSIKYSLTKSSNNEILSDLIVSSLATYRGENKE